jgi:hypothetical protein
VKQVFACLVVCLSLGACMPAAPQPSDPGAPPANDVTVRVAGAAGGETRFVAVEALPRVLAALDGRQAIVEFAPGRHRLREPIRLPSNVHLTGAGQGVTVLEAARDIEALVTVADAEAGAQSISISQLTLDCARRAEDGLRLIRVAALSLSQLTATHCTRTGVRISGHGRPTRGVTVSDLTLERNRGDGLVVMWATRNARYTNIFAYGNAGIGVVFDHSEGTASNVIADQNGGRGVHFRNLFAFSAANITATRNGRHGIFAEGFVASAGQNWIAMGNGRSAPGQWDEIRFSESGELSYGVTRDSTLSGLITGGYSAGTGESTAANGLVLEPGVGDLRVSEVVTLELADQAGE